MLNAAVRPHLLSLGFALVLAVVPAVLASGQAELLLAVMLWGMSFFGVLRILGVAWRVRLDFLPPERADRELAWLRWARRLRELGFAAAMIVGGLSAMTWGEPATAQMAPKILLAGVLYLLIVGLEWQTGDYIVRLSDVPPAPTAPPACVPAESAGKAKADMRKAPNVEPPKTPMALRRPTPAASAPPPPLVRESPVAGARTEAPPSAPASRPPAEASPSESRAGPTSAGASAEASPSESRARASPASSPAQLTPPDSQPEAVAAVGEPAHRTLSRAELRSAIQASGGVEKFLTKEVALRGMTVTQPPPPASRLATSRKEWKARRDARRAERIAAQEAAAAEAAAQHRERLISTIPYAGRGVSAGLSREQSDADRLRAAGLPVLATAEDVANFLGITVRKLHWLTYHREAADSTHYVYFAVPKKVGGERIISAPKSYLRAAQQRVLDGLLSRVAVDNAAHGFVPGRSIVTNAAAHLSRDVVVNLDLRDFFPTITFPRVRGVFVSLGYSEAAATLLALLCTECPRKRVRFTEGAIPPGTSESAKSAPQFWVAVGDRQLPQGAVTSPALTNIVCRDLDRRLTALAARVGGWTYTRYADDLTFSGSDPTGRAVGKLLAEIRGTLKFAGFSVHPDKVRIQRRTRRQTVTGLTVNTKPTVSRARRRWLRAVLHNAARTGLAAQNRIGHANFPAHLRGWAAFIGMVDRALGDKMQEKLNRILPPPRGHDRSTDPRWKS